MKDCELVEALEKDQWPAHEAKMLLLKHYESYVHLALQQRVGYALVAGWTKTQTWPIKRAVEIRKATGGAINERYLCRSLWEVS